MATEDNEDLQLAALQAVADLIRAVDPGAMVQRFVALVEVIDEDGDRAVWCLTPPGAKAWDSLGLLAYAQSIEFAGQVGEQG